MGAYDVEVVGGKAMSVLTLSIKRGNQLKVL